MITVDVKYFGVVAEETGKHEESVALDSSINTLKSLKNHILSEYSVSDHNSIQVSINQTLGNSDSTELQDGDEVAFLPPFSGG